VVSWDFVDGHLSTLIVEEAQGEKNHLLQPLEGSARVRASIASIAGTATLTTTEAIQAMECGRVIARIISDGDHDETRIKKGTNWLVLWRELPLATGAWVFVIINPERNTRERLNAFKYTPHYADEADPAPVVLTPGEETIRRSTPMLRLSAAAKDCRSRKLKACFIDPPHDSRDGNGTFPGLGGMFLMQGGSQPWVPCPLYGCCCGGNACHTGL
jgi:hypothetical protein